MKQPKSEKKEYDEVLIDFPRFLLLGNFGVVVHRRFNSTECLFESYEVAKSVFVFSLIVDLD